MTRKKLSNEHKNKISEALKGKHHSEETKRKIREASKGNTNSKGIKRSEEHKRKISEANRGNIYNKGKKHSYITKKKMSEARKGMFIGENHWNWKGGISFEIYPQGWDELLKDSIRQRDGYVCQICGIHQDELVRKLDVHHIDYNKDNLDPKNLISLCKSCHMKTNFNRGDWIEYFRIDKNNKLY